MLPHFFDRGGQFFFQETLTVSLARWVKFECVSMCQVISDRPFVLFEFSPVSPNGTSGGKRFAMPFSNSLTDMTDLLPSWIWKITQCIWCAFDATNIIHQPKITHPQPRDPEFIFSLNPLVKPYFTPWVPDMAPWQPKLFQRSRWCPSSEQEQWLGTVVGRTTVSTSSTMISQPTLLTLPWKLIWKLIIFYQSLTENSGW